jgi:hypothetical protein
MNLSDKIIGHEQYKKICVILQLRFSGGEPDSSVSIASGYGLDDWEVKVRPQQRRKDFSCSLCVQTGSGAHPASCKMGMGARFTGLKRGREVKLTTHPHLVLRWRMSRTYTSSPPSAFVACSGTALAFNHSLDVHTFSISGESTN